MLYNFNYFCPFCDHALTKNSRINFITYDKENSRINIQLSAVPGEYGYKSDPEISLKNGERLDFYCPTCQEDLTSKNCPEFVEIHLKVNMDITFEVLFSPVCGEKVTYVIMEDEMVKYRDDFFSIMTNHSKAS